MHGTLPLALDLRFALVDTRISLIAAASSSPRGPVARALRGAGRWGWQNLRCSRLKASCEPITVTSMGALL